MASDTADSTYNAFLAAFPLPAAQQQFTAEIVRRSSGAHDTFTKRQNHNERFILYLFETEALHPFLHDEFLHELTDINTAVDYSDVINKYRKYRRNGGKKTLEERKEECRIKLLRDHIAHTLNTPGLQPRGQTVNFDALENNVDVFVNYLTTCRRNGVDVMKPKTYSGLRSSFTYLFRRYRRTTSRQFDIELSECMEGIKRYTTELACKGRIEEDKCEDKCDNCHANGKIKLRCTFHHKRNRRNDCTCLCLSAKLAKEQAQLNQQWKDLKLSQVQLEQDRDALELRQAEFNDRLDLLDQQWKELKMNQVQLQQDRKMLELWQAEFDKRLDNVDLDFENISLPSIKGLDNI